MPKAPPPEGDPMTYNRMEAKPIAGEHCRFCGDASAPLVKTPCCQQWSVAIRPLCRCEAAGSAKWSTNASACVIPTMRINMAALGKAVRNAVISGCHEMTKPMPKTQSIGPDIEGCEINEVQIPDTKIEL